MTSQKVSYEKARAALQRLTHGAFRRDGEHLDPEARPRFSIPCRPDHDDDTVMVKYMVQQEALEAKLRAALSALLKVRPSNWDDDEDAEQAAAWRAAEEALAAAEGGR